MSPPSSSNQGYMAGKGKDGSAGIGCQSNKCWRSISGFAGEKNGQLRSWAAQVGIISQTWLKDEDYFSAVSQDEQGTGENLCWNVGQKFSFSEWWLEPNLSRWWAFGLHQFAFTVLKGVSQAEESVITFSLRLTLETITLWDFPK